MADLLGIQEWLTRNHAEVSRYSGKWIAVSASGVVKTDESLEALSQKLSPQEAKELLLTRVPTKKEAASLVFGGWSG